MFNEKFMEVISHEGVVSIVSWGKDEPHVVNTWNSYLVIQDGNKLLIPAAGMRKTQGNTDINNRVKLTLGSKDANKKMGTGFLLEGTAEFLAEGAEYDMTKAKFSFASRVLIITVTSVKQTI